MATNIAGLFINHVPTRAIIYW